MQCSIHVIANGFSEAWVNPGAPRRYAMDNGQFDLNMMIESVEIMPASVQNSQLDFGNSTVFFVVARTEEGATPTSVSSESVDAFGLRFNDPNIVAWGTISADTGVNVILRSDQIIPNDLYTNAWSITTGGSLTTIACSIGYIIKMKQVKQTGTAALLQQTIADIYRED